MPIIYYRILFFTLIPVGIFILIKGIKQLRKCFYGNLLLELPYLNKSGRFEVLKAGTHSIWFKGQLYRRIPSDQFRPIVFSVETGKEVDLHYSFFAPSIHGFGDGRVEVLMFKAEIGQYRIELQEGSSIPKLLSGLAKLTRVIKPIDEDKFFIQVRESQPRILTLLGVPIILIGVGGIIGGFVVGLLADQLF